jgi:hypothetical protein
MNDRRIHATHKISINTDTHMLFTWDMEGKMWVLTPAKIYPHTIMNLTNLEAIVRIRTPEKKNFEPQTTIKDLKDADFANQVLSAIDYMNKQPEPACMENLRKSIEKERSRGNR